MVYASAAGSVSVIQTFKFEEIQTLHFEVYDMDTDFISADASDVDLSKQVRGWRRGGGGDKPVGLFVGHMIG